jgi:hypothetical protein
MNQQSKGNEIMRTPLQDWSISDLAFATGHKVTEVELQRTVLSGKYWLCKFDGKWMKLAEARKIMEAQWQSNERKQGTPCP